MLLNQEVNGGVNQMINYSGDSKNPANNANNINKQCMPLLVTEHMQDSHRVSLILKVDHRQLR